MAKDQIAVLNVDDQHVDWVTYAFTKSGPQAVDEGSIEIPLAADETPDETALKAATAELPSNGVLVMAPRHVLIRILRLPTTEREEIAGMLELQADQLSPFPLDQVVLAHEVMSQDDASTTVSVAITKIATIEAQAARLPAVSITRVDASVLGLWNGFLHSGQLKDVGREMLLVVEQQGIQVIVHEGGALRLMVYVAGPFDATRDDDCQEIAREAERLLLTLESPAEPGDAPVTAAVWADGDAAASIADAVGEVCGIDCHAFDHAMLPDGNDGIMRRSTAGGDVLNLAPTTWYDEEERVRFRRRLIVGVGGGVALILILLGVLFGLLTYQGHRNKALMAEDRKWLEPANEVREMRRRVTMIERYTGRDNSALECLRDIALRMPQRIDLDAFTYRKDQRVDISGIADTAQLVLQFNAALNNSPLYKRVEPGPRINVKGKYKFSFDLVLNAEAE